MTRLHNPNRVSRKISTIENKLNIVLSRGKGGDVMAPYTCHFEYQNILRDVGHSYIVQLFNDKIYLLSKIKIKWSCHNYYGIKNESYIFFYPTYIDA